MRPARNRFGPISFVADVVVPHISDARKQAGTGWKIPGRAIWSRYSVKTAITGDSICDPGRPVLLEPLEVYEPVISISVEAQTRAEQEKLLDSLSKLSEEDPTFRFAENADTGQIIVSGMGELHLEIVLNRLGRDYHVVVSAGKPQVVYRETISRSSEGAAVFDREIGGASILRVFSCIWPQGKEGLAILL